MNILLAPDSFKGTLAASEVCDIIESALKNRISDCNITKFPAADGGEGLCSCFSRFAKGSWITAAAADPFGKAINAKYYLADSGTAVIETAACAGLPLADGRPDPTVTTTVGVGMLIRDAAERGVKQIILGLGGSATNDCGAGMASALGFRFIDRDKNLFLPVGGTLKDIAYILPPENSLGVPVIAACDVTNPLYGKNGAAYVFAPQKGADEKQVELLDLGLCHMSELFACDLGANVADMPGAGAAGGLGAGAVAFLNASLKSGIDIVLDEGNFDALAASADIVVTGEGRFDRQSIDGKVMSGVCSRARRAGARIAAVCGCASSDADPAVLGITWLFTASDGTHSQNELQKLCRAELYDAACALACKIAVYR